MEEIKENKTNRFLHRTLLPDKSGFKTLDSEIFKYDKYKGWYDENGVYYNNLGLPSLIPKSQPPDSDRFKNNKLLEDGSGFELPTGEIFFFTSVGGWYDEYKNYYDENGKPAKSPKYFEDVSSVDFSRFSKSEGKDAGYIEEDADDENEQDPQLDNKEDLLGPSVQKNKEFKFEHKQNKAENKIEKLAQIISQYESLKLIKISIDKISEKANMANFIEFFNKNVNNEIKMESIEIVPSSIKHNKFSYIVSLDKASALKFIHLQGKNFMGETMNLTIDSITKDLKELSDDENDIVSSDHNIKEPISTNEKFKSGDEDISLTYSTNKNFLNLKQFNKQIKRRKRNLRSLSRENIQKSFPQNAIKSTSPDLIHKSKKNQASLHSLPKFDKSCSYFSQNNTSLMTSFPNKVLTNKNSEPQNKYYMNQNLRKASLPKSVKDQSKSISNLTEIVSKKENNFDLKKMDLNNTSQTEKSNINSTKIYDTAKELNLSKIEENRNEGKKPQVKVSTLRYLDKTNEKSFRDAYEIKYKKVKTYNKNILSKLSPKIEKKENLSIETSTADIMLTEFSDAPINELPDTKPICNKAKFSRNLAYCNREKDLIQDKSIDVSIFNNQNMTYDNGNGTITSIDDSIFIIKNQDTGEIYDIREVEKIKPITQASNKPEYFERLKKRQNMIWQDWWQVKKENNNKFLESVKNNNLKTIADLFDEKNLDHKPEINVKDQNSLAGMHYACLNGNYNIVLFLLKNEANMEILNNLKQTPLMIAASKGHENIVSLLLTSGCDINAQDIYDNSALHYACLYNYKEVVATILLRVSVNITLKNKEQKSPLDLNQDMEINRIFQNYFLEQEKKEEENKTITIHTVNTKTIEKMLEVKASFFKAGLPTNCSTNLPTSMDMTQFFFNQKSNQNTNNNSLNDVTSSSCSNDINEEKLNPSNFNMVCLIGRGSFGEVYLVEKISNKSQYAMKVLHKEKILKHNLVKYAMTERNVLSCINHPFIVKLNYAFQTDEELFLILDYCPGGDLSKYLRKEKKFSEEKARNYICEILLALEHLHQRDIIYRDLKPDNVVLDSRGHALLTDFGLSKEGVYDNLAAKSFCGSIAYLAPEMLKQTGHGKAVDWYLLGVLLYEMLVGTPPYYSNNREEIFRNIEGSKLNFPSSLSAEAKSLLKGLLQKNPFHRLGSGKNDAKDIKVHKFFDGIIWEDAMKRKLKVPKPYIFLERKIKPIDIDFGQKNDYDPNNLGGWSFVNANITHR